MPATLTDGWKTRYAPFEAARTEGDGLVELLLLEAKETTQDTRTQEANTLARLIRSMASKYEVYEDGKKRCSSYADMTILLKRRTHLGLFEAALRDEGVPFVVLKGIGFYDEPETAILREMISFIIDPSDAHSLFCILRSPLFELDYKTLSSIFRGNTPPFEKLAVSEQKRLCDIHAVLASWLSSECPASLAYRLECILTSTGGWRHYHERQRQANLRKFITLIEGLEAEGLPNIEIRETLLRQRFARDEAKANINAEGMNAVRIMTIHAAKGLQFPMVFLPSLDEPFSARTGAVVFDDTAGRLAMGYEEDSRLKNKNELFRRQRAKLEEEEKRLFYVAVTRARDYLCMTGSIKEDKLTGRLAYFDEAFDVTSNEREGLPFSIIRAEDVEHRAASAAPPLGEAVQFMDVPEYTEPIIHKPPLKRMNVTELNLAIERRRHGPRATLIGTVLHRLFEDLSEGRMIEEQIAERVESLLHEETADYRGLLDEVLSQFEHLKKHKEIFDIIIPPSGVRHYAELPFEYEADGILYRGRMDRLNIKDETAHVYDYKTFPVNNNEIAGLRRHYAAQMDIYARAASALFNLPVKAYLVFTHLPSIEELGRQ
jgi:ATP-dependent helicase/nuclease subunit A